MSWWPLTSRAELPVLTGSRLALRLPVVGDFAAWAQIRSRSRAGLVPFEPVWPADDLTAASFTRRCARVRREALDGSAFGFLLIGCEDGAILGGITLSNIRRGVAQAGTLGYWTGAPYRRQGLMLEAVRLVLADAFGRLGLHRVEAACLVDNAASAGLLEKAGFQREGLARRYLCINGAWQDHLLYARLATDGRSGR